jgi:hypothetical protein
VFFITQNSMPPQLLTFGRLNGTGPASSGHFFQ